MKVVVTGSAGRIGRAIHARLKAGGHQVLGLDQAPCSVSDVVASITDEDAVRRALEGADAVVHTAALHAPHVGHRTEAEFEAVNVAATARLVDLMKDAGVPRMVFTSTTALYGAGGSVPGQAAWVDEDTIPRPRTIYHRTKVAAELALDLAAENGELAVTILRMSRCFPEPAPLMAAYRLHRGIDARDVADAHAIALDWNGRGVRRFVVSARTPFAREDAAELFANAPAVLARKAPKLVHAFRARGWALPATIDRVYDSTRARMELGWEPRHGFEEVIAQAERRSLEVLPA